MKYLSTLLLFALLIACDSDDDGGINPLPDPNINLDQPRVGQQTTFLRIEGNCGWSADFHYTTDTLLVEVVKEGDVLSFRESFTPGSPLYETNTDPVTYPVMDEDGFLLIPEREQSSLFFFYGNDTIFTKNIEPVTAVQNECTPMVSGDVFRGDDIAFIEDIAIHDVALRDQIIVSCVPVIFDLEAYLCYNQGELNLSYTLSSGFPGLSLNAWVRLDQ